jgi:glutamate-1-semialdehyde aminotransferase
MSVQRLFKRHPKEIAAVIVELICDDSSSKNLVHWFAPVAKPHGSSAGKSESL